MSDEPEDINVTHKAFEVEWAESDFPKDDPVLKVQCENWFVRGIRVHTEQTTEQFKGLLSLFSKNEGGHSTAK